MKRTHTATCWGAVALSCWLLLGAGRLAAIDGRSRVSHRPKPLPAGPDAFTQRDLHKAALTWAQRTMVDAYGRLGRRDPSWDAQALVLLELAARHYAGAPEAPTPEAMLQAAEPLMTSACDDPLVLYCVGEALHMNQRLDEAERFLERADRGFEDAKYARAWARSAAMCMARVTQWQDGRTWDDVNHWVGRSIQWAGESARDGSYADGEQRLFWVNMTNDLGRYEPMKQRLYHVVVGQEGSDPWVSNMVAGWYHIKSAWDARGCGWADAVTKEGWKGFHEHLEKASEHLRQAHELHPEFPEAATRMITVVTGAGGPPGETARFWFDRAVAAQFDYLKAYSRLIWALRPRWGGSVRAMLDLAEECLATGRFDTTVPQNYFGIVRDLDREEGVGAIWEMPGVYGNLCTLYRGLIAEASRAHEVHWWKSMWPITAWRCKRYGEARQMFDALGDGVNPECALQFFTRLNVVKGETYAFTGPSAAEVLRAENLYRDEQRRAEALPVFEELAADATHEWARSFLRGREVTLRTERDLSSGDWVDILPKEGLAGWEHVAGTWTADSRGLQATPAQDGLMLVCSSNIGGNYELRGTVRFVPGPQVQAGAVVEYKVAHGPRWAGLRLYWPFNQVSLGVNFSAQKQTKKIDLKEVNSFLIRVRENKVTVFVNDQPIFVNYEVEDKAPEETSRVGLGGRPYSRLQTSVWYQSLQIRRLTSPTGP